MPPVLHSVCIKNKYRFCKSIFKDQKRKSNSWGVQARVLKHSQRGIINFLMTKTSKIFNLKLR